MIKNNNNNNKVYEHTTYRSDITAQNKYLQVNDIGIIID